MAVLRPRATRYPFISNVTLTDLETGRQIHQMTRDLSLFGCKVAPGDSMPLASKVRIQITHNGETFDAQGRVTSFQPLSGVGIVFTKVEERYTIGVDKWIAALRKEKSQQ